ncbi:MAG: hypothetical protein PHI59_03865 [Candidatus Omnitrophica bacterium]|nr:hypothetical protein [Candidatus Omnitrophota bacterium]
MNTKINSNLLKGEKFLIDIDSQLGSYATHNKMRITKNYQDWPERTLSWKSSGMHKMLQIYLEKNDVNTFLLWGCVYKDRMAKRHLFKKEAVTLESPLQWNKIESQMNSIKDELDKISEKELK